MAYKVFQNGFPLNASELNNYLMNQSVMVFATATARDTDLTAPLEGMIVWLQDSNKFVYYTGSAWTDVIVPPIADVAGKNKIINGAFDIWQRGTSFVNTSAAWTYTADRWDSGRLTGTTGSTLTRQASGLTGFQYALRFQRNNGDTATTDQFLVQRLDTATSLPLAGQTVTLSWYARAGANYSPASSALKLFAYTGTGTDQGGYPSLWTGSSTVVNGTSFTLTTSWQRFTSTFAVGSAATQVGFLFQYTGVGTAGAADYYDITGVQLEVGSSATSFSRAAGTLQGEFAACQRYMELINSYDAVGTVKDSTTAYFNYYLKVPKRVNPTLSFKSTTYAFDITGITSKTGTSQAATLSQANLAVWSVSGSSGLTLGQHVSWNGGNIWVESDL